jgi:plasmid replication initiation protein
MSTTKKKIKAAKTVAVPSKPGMREFGLAVLHNELARCSTDMGVVALRLIMLLADKARQDGDFLATRFRVEVYKDKLQLSGKSAYENLYHVVRRLMQTIIETPHAVEGIDMFQVLAPSRLIPGKGEFELRFNEQMRPLLLNLRAHFAKIPLPIFFRIQGSYAVRFYLFCKSWDPALNRSPGWRMTVDELRAWLGIQPGEYEQTFHIRAAIIERAKEELDQVADVSFRYDPVMDGKRIIGWDFVPVPNKPKDKALPAKRRAKKLEEKESAENASAFLENLEQIDGRWIAADPNQRQKWLEAMPEETRMFFPKPGDRPSRLFLVALKNVLEPRLPGID